MRHSIGQGLPEAAVAQQILDTYFASASPLGRRLERLHLQELLAGSADSAYTSARQNGPAGVLCTENKPWESSFFGCPAVLLTLVVAGGVEAERGSLARSLLRRWSASPLAASREYATTRVAADDTPVIQALEAAGFRMLAPTVTLERPLRKNGAGRPPTHLVDLARETDIVPAQDIARVAYVYGRYWVEPGLPHSVAGEMHATWAANCIRGQQADATFVVRQSETAAGFLGAKHQQAAGLNIGVIILTAVAGPARGQGIGGALVEASCDWARQRGASDMVVRTEAPNTGAMRLYEKHRFTTASAGIYFGRWR